MTIFAPAVTHIITMNAAVISRAKQWILRTSLWVLSTLIMLSASSASAADSSLQQAILVHWAGHPPAPSADTQEQAGPNNELHHSERKATRILVVNHRSPFVPNTIGALQATTSPHVGTHGPGALTRPAYYQFLFRYKPF